MPYLIDSGGVFFQLGPSRVPIEICAETSTFEALDTPWAKDAATVFYNGVPVSGAEPSSFHVREIDGADAETFLGLGGDYAKDAMRVYCRGIHLEARAEVARLLVEGLEVPAFPEAAEKYLSPSV